MKRHLGKWIQRWHRVMCNDRTLRKLDGISPAERRRLADDVGLSGSDLRRFNCTHEEPTALLPARLWQLSIDPAYIRHARTVTYRDLERICATCKSWRRCTRDLAKGDPQTGMATYCLNAPTIDTLTVDWPKRAAGA